MLSFDEERFIRIQSGAVGLAGPIHEVMADCIATGIENIVYAGAGGAGILMGPAERLLRARSTLPAEIQLPAELVAGGSAQLGPNSLVVIPSLSGTTTESIDAMHYCQSRGATVVALTGHEGTPLADGADHTFVNFAEDDTSCESFYVQSLLLALSAMSARGEFDGYDDVVGRLSSLPSALVETKGAFEARAASMAAAIAANPFHIITGAGSTWPEAVYYGMCVLEEMQWIRTRPVHASDFFHGTLELVEDGVSVLLLKGEDSGRAMVERVEKFATSYTDQVQVIDTADLRLPGISGSVRALLSPVLLATVLERVSAHLEVLRDHPLTTRRYYKRVAY